MTRFLLALVAALLLAAPAQAAPHLERVVIVLRHGTRPPTVSNADLAKFADRPWPAWPVAPGELTPHGGEGVRLMGETVAATYRAAGVLPPTGCASAGQVAVWADNADQRTRQTGRIFANALQPGCGLAAHWSPAAPRDPIFTGTNDAACAQDPDKASAAIMAIVSDPLLSSPLDRPLARLQAIMAPTACAGGPGTCFAKTQPTVGPRGAAVVYPNTPALAEDLLLEYVDGMPMADVGWGRASRADIVDVMAIHEHLFALVRDNAYAADRRGAPMARIILAALAGAPVGGGPQSGPDTRVFVLAGHDTNLAWMAGVFGLRWRFDDMPHFTAPATTLAFELWSDHGRQYVRPVVYHLALDQLRTLEPPRAETTALQFPDCANGPLQSCPLETLRHRLETAIPRDCGTL